MPNNYINNQLNNSQITNGSRSLYEFRSANSHVEQISKRKHAEQQKSIRDNQAPKERQFPT